MDQPKVVYTAHASATGGRDGRAVSSDGVIDVKLSVPKEMGGGGGAATNPEQLFAAGLFRLLPRRGEVRRRQAGREDPRRRQGSADVGIGPIPTGFAIKVDLHVSLPGIEHAQAQTLVDAAHIVCPYSNATRNNVDVTIAVV